MSFFLSFFCFWLNSIIDKYWILSSIDCFDHLNLNFTLPFHKVYLLHIQSLRLDNNFIPNPFNNDNNIIRGSNELFVTTARVIGIFVYLSLLYKGVVLILNALIYYNFSLFWFNALFMYCIQTLLNIVLNLKKSVFLCCIWRFVS